MPVHKKHNNNEIKKYSRAPQTSEIRAILHSGLPFFGGVLGQDSDTESDTETTSTCNKLTLTEGLELGKILAS